MGNEFILLRTRRTAMEALSNRLALIQRLTANPHELEAINKLMAMAKGDEEELIRREAVRALRDVNNMPEAQMLLVEILDTDPSGEVRMQATGSLHDASLTEAARKKLIEMMLGHRLSAVREAAAGCLTSAIESPEVKEIFMREVARADSCGVIRRHVVKGLARGL
ncbi:MAG: HEAT repeat domain-containing protein, partial [Chloracidobacterium sp.]